ncbi:MAG: geranylgeranyl reductase family protein, partial [Bacteroidota bacterium]
YKVCGGGLTHKIITEIPFDISEVTESTIHSIRFSKDLSNTFTRTSETPLIYCTMREKLDQFLLERAVEAGAMIRFEQAVEVSTDGDDQLVKTKSGQYNSRIVIGADGPSSIIARSCGLRNRIMQGLAWEAEIYTDLVLVELYAKTVFLDWGTFPGGYGWVFPKKDHFSIGVGGPASLSKQMMPYYDRFLQYLDFGKAPETKSPLMNPVTQSLKSWPIPVRLHKGPLHAGNVIVAGDAAGLTDSLTGEGIYYAIMSGKMAGYAALEQLRGNNNALQEYSEKVNDTLLDELLEGEKIKHIFNTFPLRIHLFVKNSDRAWRAFGKVLRGERSYRDVKLGFGKWSIFWNVIASLSKHVEKWRERRF